MDKDMVTDLKTNLEVLQETIIISSSNLPRRQIRVTFRAGSQQEEGSRRL